MTPAVCLNDNDTIVFIGDSITDAEKHRRAYHPLGWGYVHFAANFLRARHPDLTISIITPVSAATPSSICRIGGNATAWRISRTC